MTAHKSPPPTQAASTSPHVETKLAAPSMASALLQRSVYSAAHQVLENRLTIVHAPGGYGKTTTIAQWAKQLRRSGTVTTWMSLDEYDTEPTRILSYLGQSFSLNGLAIPVDLLSRCDAAVDSIEKLWGLLLTSVLNDGRQIVLFYDDLHLLDTRGPVENLFIHLIRTAPKNLHFVFASRERPAHLLGRLGFEQRPLEFDADDLRLGIEETNEFFKTAGVRLDNNSDLAELHAASEGWIAGLKLAVSGGGDNIGRMKAILQGETPGINDFFAYDVFERQPPHIQAFLIKTSIVDCFSVNLASALTGEDTATDIIATIKASGLFIFSLENTGGWFRYHHLFSSFLRKILRSTTPEMERILHLKASRWLWENGYIEQAFHHAVDADALRQAAEILNAHCDGILNEGRPAELLTMTEKLSKDVLRDFPKLALIKAWALIVFWQFEKAHEFLEIAENAISNMQPNSMSGDTQLEELHWRQSYVSMLYARFRDQLDSVGQSCTKLLSMPAIDDPDILGVTYDTLIHVESNQFNFSQLNYLERKTAYLLGERDRPYIKIWHKATIGRARLLEGDTKSAISACQQGIDTAQALPTELGRFAAIPGLILSEIRYHRNELDEARALSDKYWDVSSDVGFPEQLISAYLIRSRLFGLADDIESAEALLDDGLRQAEARNYERMRHHMVCELVSIALRRGDLERAKQILSKTSFAQRYDGLAPTNDADISLERQALTWARYSLADGRNGDARRLALHWRDFAFQAGAGLSIVRWSILLTVIALRDGDGRAAARHLRSAVRAADQGKFIRLFLDEGLSLVEVLRALEDVYARSSDVHSHFLQSIIANIDHAEGQVSSQTVQTDVNQTDYYVHGKLGEREFEILNCISSDLSNREIGDILGMTEGTVKWHLQNIYDKLGVRRRQLALQKARRLGILN